MMSNLKKAYFFMLILSYGIISCAQLPTKKAATTKPKKVLFVGNSYTYFWNLPQNVALMAEAKGIDLITAQSTAGGVNLGQHWNYQKDLKTRDLINEGNYDVVVLQDHSKRAIEAPDSLLFYGKLLADLIKNRGGQPYVYMTWAREYDPSMQLPISEKYTELAKGVNAQIAPVGLAWQEALASHPDLKLYDADQSHPSALGTYLTACVFFGVLTKESPVGLPNRLVTTDKNGEKLYINIQSIEAAAICQKIAAEVINEFID